MEAFWRRELDPFPSRATTPRSSFARAICVLEPGMAMLAYAVTAALKGRTRRHPHAPAGTRDAPDRDRRRRVVGGLWRTPVVDGFAVANWGGGAFTARAVARLGRLMMHRGEWLGRGQVLDAAWVDRALAYAGTPAPPRPAGNPQPLPGLCWWLNADGVWPNVPRDAFGGAGAGNQMLLVIPSLDLVIVRNGATLGDPAAGEGFWGGAVKYLFDPLMAAISAPRPAASAPRRGAYPPNPVIRKCALPPWRDRAPRRRLGQLADHLGGGRPPVHGLRRRVRVRAAHEEKPAGVRRRRGDRRPRHGNLRAPTGERLGGRGGAQARPPRRGRALMLARNAGTRLAWSEDRADLGWADWRWTESGARS